MKSFTEAEEEALGRGVRAGWLWSLGLLLVVGLGITAACRTPVPSPVTPSPSVAPVWPRSGAPARIRWHGEIRGPADLGIRPGFWSRLWGWVSGQASPRLVRPYGVALDPRGRLWVTDPGSRRVHVFDPYGGRYTVLPQKGVAPFLSPIGVTHDPNGVAYVSDSALRVIRRFSPSGSFLGDWNADGDLKRPTGVAFDAASGLLWVVDTGRHLLLALDSAGRVRRYIGTRGTQSGRFNYPTHLAIDSAGHLLVTDTLNFHIQILDTDGEAIGSIGHLGDGPGGLSKPKGVAVDSDGHIYAVDGLFDNVQIFDTQGRLLLYFGEHGRGPGEFWLPAGICVSPADRIYVADSYNQRIQVFDYLRE